MPTVTKRCPRCGVEKDRNVEFNTSGWCRQCQRESQLARYRGDEGYREARKAYHRDHERLNRADPVKNEATLAALRERRLADPVWRRKNNDAASERRRRTIGKALVQQAVARARRDGREMSLSRAEMQARWEASSLCAYCSKQLVVGDGKHGPSSPTIDRVDTERGYTSGNMVFACFRCNTLKRDSNPDELEALVANIRRVVHILSPPNA